MASNILGLIKPTDRAGSRTVANLIKMLPTEVKVVETNVNIRRGTREELEQALTDYEVKIAEVVAEGAELVHPAGVPPLLLGYEGERKLVAGWEQKFGRPVFTNGMSQVNALRAFDARRIIGISYFPGQINHDFAHYLQGAGFDVLAMEGMQVEFERVLYMEKEVIRAFIRNLFDQHRGIDAIYLLGSAWPTLEMVESFESEFAVPVIHHVPCQCWEIQKRFGLHQPVTGYGRLMREMP